MRKPAGTQPAVLHKSSCHPLQTPTGDPLSPESINSTGKNSTTPHRASFPCPLSNDDTTPSAYSPSSPRDHGDVTAECRSPSSSDNTNNYDTMSPYSQTQPDVDSSPLSSEPATPTTVHKNVQFLSESSLREKRGNEYEETRDRQLERNESENNYDEQQQEEAEVEEEAETVESDLSPRAKVQRSKSTLRTAAGSVFAVLKRRGSRKATCPIEAQRSALHVSDCVLFSTSMTLEEADTTPTSAGLRSEGVNAAAAMDASSQSERNQQTKKPWISKFRRKTGGGGKPSKDKTVEEGQTSGRVHVILCSEISLEEASTTPKANTFRKKSSTPSYKAHSYGGYRTPATLNPTSHGVCSHVEDVSVDRAAPFPAVYKVKVSEKDTSATGEGNDNPVRITRKSSSSEIGRECSMSSVSEEFPESRGQGRPQRWTSYQDSLLSVADEPEVLQVLNDALYLQVQGMGAAAWLHFALWNHRLFYRGLIDKDVCAEVVLVVTSLGAVRQQYYAALRAQHFLDCKGIDYYVIDINQDIGQDLPDTQLFSAWNRRGLLMHTKRKNDQNHATHVLIPQVLVDGVPLGDDISLQDLEDEGDLDWIIRRRACGRCLSDRTEHWRICRHCGQKFRSIVADVHLDNSRDNDWDQDNGSDDSFQISPQPFCRCNIGSYVLSCWKKKGYRCVPWFQMVNT
eukprot:GHVQ01013128.1.p1 GENE.GHVQ01013128.1~~GHVQ01013128.1.p1  ORF type:complete len:682 (+),score=118.64 GHVQ01013128.1:697-2742(+)